MTENGSDHWSEYWAQGQLTSLPQDFSANYDGEVADFWNATFAGVPDGGRVLDLCTGNGAVALLAAAWFREHNPGAAVTAVDAAEVNPAAVQRQFPGQTSSIGDIRFISHCKVEELSLPDQSADLVTSQYGIEYCDWEEAAGQVARVLKPGGRLVIVCHTPTSDMLKYMEREQSEYEHLEAQGFFAAVDSYLEGTIAADSMQVQFQKIASDLQDEFSRTGSALYRSVLGLIHNAIRLTAQQVDEHRQALASYHGQMLSGRKRLGDMLRVNRAMDESPDWTSAFEAAGLEPDGEGQIMYRGQHNAGQFFRFRKPGDPAADQPHG